MIKSTVGDEAGRLVVVGQREVLGYSVRLLNAELKCPAWEIYIPRDPFCGKWEPWGLEALQPFVAAGLFGPDHPLWRAYTHCVGCAGEPPECASEPLYILARRLGYSRLEDCERVVETVRAVLRGDLGDAKHV